MPKSVHKKTTVTSNEESMRIITEYKAAYITKLQVSHVNGIRADDGSMITASVQPVHCLIV